MHFPVPSKVQLELQVLYPLTMSLGSFTGALTFFSANPTLHQTALSLKSVSLSSSS